MQIGAIPINNFGCGYYRLFIPLKALQDNYKNYHTQCLFTHYGNKIKKEEFTQLYSFAENKDIIIIQRRYGSDWEGYAKKVKSQGIKLIYELDDVFEGIPLENLKIDAIEMTKPSTKNSVIEMLRIADLITVSTPELKTWVSRFTDKTKVVVLKNTLDFTMWPKPHYGIIDPKNPIIIGFAGSESHKPDLRILQGTLEIINKTINIDKKPKILFGFFGFMLKEFWNMQPNVCFKMGVPFLDYATTLHALKYNIGLAPLKHCYFNECKSELRFLEYAICGTPVIGTNIAPFKRCITSDRGILIPNNTRKWVAAIKDLYSNPEERERLGRNCYEFVKKEYNIKTYVQKWHLTYKNLVDKKRNKNE